MTPQATLDKFRLKGGSRCIEIGRQVQTFLDDGLDPGSIAKVSSHLHAWCRCGLTTDNYRRLKTALAEPLQRLHSLAADLAAGDTRT